MGERPPVLIGEKVFWLGSGSGLPKAGKVKWIGRLPEMGPHWAVGIELDEALPYGGIDGTWGQRKLFKCRHKHGLIVPHTSVIPQPQHTNRESINKSVGGEFSDTEKQSVREHVPNRSATKVGKLLRALSNDEARNRDDDLLELPSTHLRNPNLERQLAILGTLRRSKYTDTRRLEGVKSEACLYSVILEKEENVFRERRRMIQGREFKRSDDTLDRTSSINSSRSVGSRRDRSSGIFSFLRWFKKERNDDSDLESPLPGSPILQRASGSITGSIDTLFSTATTRSFAFVSPSHYKPYGSANPPEIRICPGPETNTYKNRIRQRDLLRQRERNISLSEKYRLYASETLPRSVDRINEIANVLNHKDSPSGSKSSSIRRQKRPAPPPPIAKNSSSSERDLTAAIANEFNYNSDGRQHRRTLSEPSPTRYIKPCHVKGKRRAPQPPSSIEQPGPDDGTSSLQRKKRRAPPPPIQRSPSDEITEIFRHAAVNDISGSSSSLSHLETASTASTVDISQADIVATDTLRLERGYLRPNKEEKQMEVRYTPTSPVSPRPWYKRNSASRENSFSRSNERKKERDRRRVEDWMIESGIPRRPNQLPENRFNIFSKMDKTEEKRRSQISILTNISELDREAAEIVKKNKEKQQALLANHNDRFYDEANFVTSNGFINSDQRGHNGDMVTLFNSITNVTNVTVNSSFFLHNGAVGGKAPRRNIVNGNDDKINNPSFDNQGIQITQNPVITEPDQEPGPSGVGRIAKVTIEELDDFDKERNSRAQALYEANRLQRHQSPPIPTITEVSESTIASPASTVANTPSDANASPLPNSSSTSARAAEANQTKPDRVSGSIPASVLRPVVHVVWNCPRCTLENPRWKITCDACDMWRPVPCDFKEVPPKHPLPLAVLRIVEPKDRAVASDNIASKSRTDLPNRNDTSVNYFYARGEDNAPKKEEDDANINLNIKADKTKRISQGLTISDLLFNTKSSVAPKENQKCKNIPHVLDSSRTLNSNHHREYQDSEELPKQHSSKQLNITKGASSNETTPSASGSSISSMSSANSDNPSATNELQRSPKRDVIEPEEIRKARLAFFEKFILPTSSIESKGNNEIPLKKGDEIQLTKIRKQNEVHYSENASSVIESGKSSVAPVPAVKVDKFVYGRDSDSRNEGKLFQERQEPPGNVNNGTPMKRIMSNGLEAESQGSHKMKREMDGQEQVKAKDTQTLTDFPYKPNCTSNREEDKKKLCEMLIEMKHSLPKRSKEEKNASQSKNTSNIADDLIKPEHVSEQNKCSVKDAPRLGAIRNPTPTKTSQNIDFGYKHEESNQSEAYLVESETIVEEIKMKKPSGKVSSSAQTSAMVRQISPLNKPPVGKEVVVPITVEEHTIKDGVLYTSVSKGAKKIGTGTFQLMRPRDFANIEAIKTKAYEGRAPLYANVDPSPTRSIVSSEATPELSTGRASLQFTPKVANPGEAEVEQLSLQLTEPQGIAHFRAGLAKTDSDSANTIAVNRLLRRLESAIARGQHELAAALAKELAQLKVNCIVTRQKPELPSSKSIQIDMFVEDKETHQGPFPLTLKPSVTVERLKLKVEREYEIPCNVQRWIIGKVLANDDKATLESLGITESGSPVFLYLVVPDDPRIPVAGRTSKAAIESEGAVGGEVIELNDNDSPTLIGTREDNRATEDELALTEPPRSKIAIPSIKQNDSPVSPNLALKTDENGSIQHHSEWKCGACTLVNGSSKTSCAACGLKQPGRFEGRDEPIARHPNDSKAIKKENVKYKAAEDLSKQDYQKLVDLEKSDLIIAAEVFECPVCLVEYQPQEGVVLRECLHVFCRACLANTVEYSDEAEVKCPFRDENYTCDSTLLEREIKALVTPEAYEQHLAKSIALAETKIGNAFHCKTPDCKGWCIFEDNVNLFRCPVCTHTSCLTCQAIHEGLDCKQFQEQLNKDSDINVESKRTKEMLQEMVDRGEAMNCPTCQVVLMKKWGCDWLRCSMCKTEICWITRGPRWGPNGKGDTSGGCQCGVNGVKCHPKCTYCH